MNKCYIKVTARAQLTTKIFISNRTPLESKMYEFKIRVINQTFRLCYATLFNWCEAPNISTCCQFVLLDNLLKVEKYLLRYLIDIKYPLWYVMNVSFYLTFYLLIIMKINYLYIFSLNH